MKSIQFVYFSDDEDESTLYTPAIQSDFIATVYHEESGKYSWRFDPTGTASVNDAFTDDDNTELMRFVFQYACSPGKMGSMSTGAAANDPIFWPLHPTFDRLWHFVRLHPDFSEFDHTWKDDKSCFGHSYRDELPFRDLFGESDRGEETPFYDNKALYENCDPKNDELPYVFDNFEWSHCTGSTGST